MIIDDVKIDVFGIYNMSISVSEDGFLGLSSKIYHNEKHESFGEYLKRRKYIQSNQIAIDEPTEEN